MKPRYRSGLAYSILTSSLASIYLGMSAQAATIVWNGASGADIDTGSNWVGGVVPSVVTPDVAQWDGTTAGDLSLLHSGTAFAGAAPNLGINFNITATNTGNLSIDSGANTSNIRFSNITIAAGAGAFTLGDGAGTFNITLGGTTPSTQTWTNDSANIATINSDVVMGLGGGGVHTLALAGAGNWALNNLVTNNGGTTTNVTKSGAGTATLSGANTYTGTTAVTGGVLNLTGTATMTGGLSVNNGGTLNLSGPFGTNAATNINIIGQAAGKGTLNIPAGVSISRGNMFIGDNSAGDGAVYQSGGTVALTVGGVDTLRIGSSASGKGYYKLSGGTLTVAEMGVGASLADTVGVMDVTAGTLTSSNWITVSRGTATSSGVMNVTGGTVNGTRLEMAGTNTLTSGSLSVLNVGGGAGTAAVNTTGSTTLGINLLSSANAAGVVTMTNLLPNGTLTTGIVNASASANPSAFVNFNGGVLKATATNAGATFMTSANIDGVYVYSGGGTIDNSNTNVTVKDLLAPTGNGLTTAPTVNTGGSGYIGVPMVKITGGGGTGATAVATVVGGAVTAVTITNPGTGYTSAPTIAFSGGGPAVAATATAAAPAANTSGAMTFLGTGTTTLTGANTYTGTTTVTGGTLSFSRTALVTPFASNITGTGNISNVGTGRVVLSGSNNYTGNTTITAGILQATTTGGLPGYNAAGKVTLSGTSRVGVSSGAWTAANIDTLLANATFGANTTGLAIDTSAGDFSYGPYTGTRSFTKLGANQLTFSGTNNYTGATLVNEGTLLLDAATLNATTITGQSIIVNNTTTGTGTITQNNGSIVSGGSGEIWVGNGTGSTAIYNLNSGTLTSNNWLTAGRDGSNSTINITGGTLNHTNTGASGGRFAIASGGGAAGVGTLNQTGGAVTDTVPLIITETTGTGVYNISGGTVDANGGVSMATGAGTSTLNLQGNTGLTGGLANGGGNEVFSTTNLTMSTAAGASTINLLGGTLAVNRIIAGAGAGVKTVNLNGGTLKLRASDSVGNLFVSGVVTTIGTAGAKVDTNGFTGTISSVLGGVASDGGLAKNGAGTLILTGANTFTGPITANGGKLQAGSAASYPSVNLVANAGGAIDFNGQYRVVAGGSAAKTFPNLTAAANGELIFNFNTTMGDNIAITSAASVSPGAKLTLAPATGTTLTPGNYTLLTAPAGLDNFTLSNSGVTTGGFYYPLSLNATPTAATLTIGAAQIAKLYYTGNGPNNLLSTIANFSTDAPGTVPSGTAATGITDIVFTAGTATVGNLSPTIDTVTALNSLEFTGTGTPAASNSVVLTGPGTLTLNAAANTFAAGTGIVVDAGAAAHTVAVDLALATTQSFTNNSANPFTASGTISGSGLTTAGTGATVLTGANTFTGPVAIAGGTTVAGSAENAGVSGPLGVGGSISFTGGTLQYSAANQFDYSGRFSSAGTPQVKIDTNGQSVTFANNVTAPGGNIQKYGAGVLTLASTATNSTAANLFTHGGTLVLDTAAKITTTGFSSIGRDNGDNSTVTVNGASQLTVAGDFNLADSTNALGVLNIADTAAVKGNTLYIGKAGTGTGVVNQTGGSFSVNAGPGDWRIGGGTGTGDAAAVGIYNISGGTFSVSSNFQPGAYGNGQMNISGTGAVTATAGFTGIGRFSTGYGVVDVSGGGSFGFTVAANRLIVAEDGTGILNVRGGSVTNASNSATAALTIGNTATGNGTVNLLGGTLTTASVGTNNVSATSRINFNGGILKASAASATYMTGLTSAYIYGGGATIDADNKAITIGQVLQTPAASSGVQSVSVTDGGTGYTTAPIVKITGGGGTGATAVATMSGGVITGIIVTSPGINYTSAPTVTLVNGLSGGSGATLSANVAANTSGGLAVSSTTAGGVVTLTAANTFTGDTTVNTGATLQLGTGATGLDGTLASTNVTNNGTLIYNRFGAASFTGTIGGTGNVTKLGAGTQTLTGSNSYTGVTTIGAGVLSVADIGVGGVNSNIGAATAAPANLVFSGGTLLYTGGTTSTARGFTINAGGATISNAADLTISGQVLVGAGTTSGFTKNGVGTLNFTNTTGTNTFANGASGGQFGIVVNEGLMNLGGTIGSPLAQTNALTGNAELIVGTINDPTFRTTELAINGGTTTVGAYIGVGRGNGTGNATTVLSINNNAIVSSGNFAIGFANGVAGYKSSPTVNFNGTSSYTDAGVFTVGESANAAGGISTVNVSGTASVTLSSVSATAVNIGAAGAAAMNQSGGSVASASAVTIARDAVSTASYNLNGGTLTAPTVKKGLGTGALNLNGGTLKASAASATFVDGVASAILDNGATIDSNGFAVTVTTPLLHGGVNPTDGGLTKQGAGTLTLSALPTYTGDTTVSAGTLSLSLDDSLADGANVKLATATAIDLNFVGTDVVSRLYINGVEQASGIWGAMGSGAAHESALITGTGLLSVTNGVSVSPYDSWATAHGLTGGDALPSADPDSDGYSNLAEFILAGEPNPANGGSNVSGLNATVDASGGNHVFSFRRSQLAMTQPGITVVYEYGSDLLGWSTAPSVPDGVTVSAPFVDFYGSGVDKIEVTIPDSLAPVEARFARMHGNTP